jgi:hypothetical protein
MPTLDTNSWHQPAMSTSIPEPFPTIFPADFIEYAFERMSARPEVIVEVHALAQNPQARTPHLNAFLERMMAEEEAERATSNASKAVPQAEPSVRTPFAHMGGQDSKPYTQPLCFCRRVRGSLCKRSDHTIHASVQRAH